MRCYKCPETDPLAFPVRKTPRNVALCKSCKRSYNKGWYEKNKTNHVQQVGGNNRRYRREIINKLNDLKSRPCSDCGKVFHPCAMDFDHRDPSLKIGNISRMKGRANSLDRILQEAAKCDLVCAVCHRIRTFKRSCGVPLDAPCPR